ncbi:MAG: hypothetical protein ACLT0Y_08275 [Christensenellales bacterium]
MAPIFWTVGTIEVFTYAPMLGAGGSYLGFVTGNLTNLKVPCALNAMRSAGVEPGSEEGEVPVHVGHRRLFSGHHRYHHPRRVHAVARCGPYWKARCWLRVCQHFARAVWRAGRGVCL